MSNEEAIRIVRYLINAVDEDGIIDTGMYFRGIQDHIRMALCLAADALEREENV